MNLVIVESPTKARTISQFLDKNYKVESSYGHIRDLPKSKLGVNIEHNFEPQYVIPTKARKKANFLKKEAEKADAIILATDEDREGEAIAWHIAQILNLGEIKNQKSILRPRSGLMVSEVEPSKIKNLRRIVFHEITKSAIEEALEKPRGININLVNAQQARRILDRLVGYQLSPFLWEKIMKRLSAGRVQSAALRLITEREEEIRNFKPEEYWSIEALLQSRGTAQNKTRKNAENVLSANLYKINNETIPKLGIKTKEETDKIVKELESCNFKASKIKKKEVKRNPLPPFTTSTLQQTASQRLRFSAKQTMRLAQNLYENGLITYMRTDSLNLSKQSVFAAKNWIEQNLGKDYVGDAPRFFKTKSRLAQEAHEAIRPTQPEITPEKIKTANTQEKKLYELIWQRFIVSQLPQAIFDSTRIEIEARNSKLITHYSLLTTGNVLRFDGFLKIWSTNYEKKELPAVEENEILELKKIVPLQHFTEPAARYNEASLIKTLEENGIGRPSTYAPIISVIQERNYVLKNERRHFQPTEIGEAVNKILVQHFPEIVDIQFTAKMEDEFDEIAKGEKKWQKVIGDFYGPFSKNLKKKYEEVEKQKPINEKTDEICEKCGKPMIIKYGRFGKFIACSGFPECKNTKTYNQQIATNDDEEEIKCPKCAEGKIVRRRTKRAKFFFGCSKYPACNFASWTKPNEKRQGE